MTDIIDQNILFYVLLVLVEPQCTLINQVMFGLSIFKPSSLTMKFDVSAADDDISGQRLHLKGKDGKKVTLEFK